MPIKFSDLEDAFLYVSGSGYGMNYAYICKETGQSYTQSEEYDNFEELPADLETSPDKYLEVPHKDDIGLGSSLAKEFARIHLGDRADKVYDYFRRKGAYAKFRALLVKTNNLEKWYEFEEKRTKEELRELCKLEEIELIEEPAESAEEAAAE